MNREGGRWRRGVNTHVAVKVNSQDLNAVGQGGKNSAAGVTGVIGHQRSRQVVGIRTVLQRKIASDIERATVRVAVDADVSCVDPRRMSVTLRGELDWIVMKALEKDRQRRYESPSALAADVGRYLKNEAVEACPPSRIFSWCAN